MGTKEDMSEMSIDQYNNMMSGDPDDIIQSRVPDEALFPKVQCFTHLQLILGSCDSDPSLRRLLYLAGCPEDLF